MLVWAIEEGPPTWGVREIAEAVDMTPSTTHRSIMSLVRQGFVEPEGDGRYRLGLETYRLARIAASRLKVEELARDPMLKLFEACSETVVLVLYERGRPELLNASCIASDHSIVGDQYSVQVVVEINRWVPITMNATALTICSELTEGDQESFVSSIRFERGSPVTRKLLPSALQTARENRYAMMEGYPNKHAIVIASPILRHNGSVVGALSLAMPISRFESEDRLAPLVVKHASSIKL
jgi:IclR family transcriptional regulator, KDG regulon repressor